MPGLNVDKRAIGLRVKKVREGLGLTQRNLGELLQLSHATVSGYELGDSFPSINTLLKIAEIGKVSITWLIIGDDLVESLDKLLPPDDVRLLRAFHRADEDDKRVILRVAELVVGNKGIPEG